MIHWAGDHLCTWVEEWVGGRRGVHRGQTYRCGDRLGRG